MNIPLGVLKGSSCLRHWIAVVLLILLGACAGGARVGSGVIAHGILTEIKGTQDIQSIQVLYGNEIISFKGVYRTGGGSSWSAPMPVPDKMTVHWMVNGKPQTAVIPLTGKTSPKDRLVRWRLRFFGERIEVWRDDDDPTSSYYFKAPVQIYP